MHIPLHISPFRSTKSHYSFPSQQVQRDGVNALVRKKRRQSVGCAYDLKNLNRVRSGKILRNFANKGEGGGGIHVLVKKISPTF